MCISLKCPEMGKEESKRKKYDNCLKCICEAQIIKINKTYRILSENRNATCSYMYVKKYTLQNNNDQVKQPIDEISSMHEIVHRHCHLS